jgi:hypothetical protein
MSNVSEDRYAESALGGRDAVKGGAPGGRTVELPGDGYDDARETAKIAGLRDRRGEMGDWR